MLQFLCNHLFTFNILLGTDAMTSKDTQRRLIKENNNRPRDPKVLDVRRTVSTRSPFSDLKCPMQIIIFLGPDDRFYLSPTSCLNIIITLLSKLMLYCVDKMTWSKLIWFYSLFYSVLMQPAFKFHKLCKD